MSISANELIAQYNMQRHPEGGFYVETFRSDILVKTDRDGVLIDRPASTAIFFLIMPGNISRFHRIQSDEVWHFYLGGPMTVVELLEDGSGLFKQTVLGTNISNGEVITYVVKKNTWFGSFPNESSDYSFVGCTVSPGFVFDDFELGSRARLLESHPNSADIIHKMTEGLP